MPKWKKNETEFNVSVTYHQHRGYQDYVTKPIMDVMITPKSIKFILKDNKRIELIVRVLAIRHSHHINLDSSTEIRHNFLADHHTKGAEK